MAIGFDAIGVAVEGIFGLFSPPPTEIWYIPTKNAETSRKFATSNHFSAELSKAISFLIEKWRLFGSRDWRFHIRAVIWSRKK